MQIMMNPHRGRAATSPSVSYGAAATGRRPLPHTNGHVTSPSASYGAAASGPPHNEDVPNGHITTVRQTANDGLSNAPSNRRGETSQTNDRPALPNSRGGFGQPHPRGGSAFNTNIARGGGYLRGRGGFSPQFVGRGGFSRGFRGRGRGSQAPTVQS